jgi:putative serine protease PepD
VTARPGGFDGNPEEDPASPLLPPQDRLWRHPSELDPVALHPDAVRRRWLLSHPSRRSILTAGIVGALVASAVAAIATHLADSISTPQPPKVVDATTHIVVSRPGSYPMSADMAAAVNRVAAALVTVEATTGKVQTRELGVVIRSDGTLLAPARGIAGTQSLLVTLADGDVYVGYVVGADLRSGLAVVHINGADDLPTVTFTRSAVIAPSVALALSSPGRDSVAIGMLHDTHAVVRVGGTAIVGAMRTDFPPAYCPVGSALMSSAGTIDGIVVGDSNGAAVVAPAWLASNVARDLIAAGSVVQGWLGVRGVTNSGWPGGVRIVAMAKKSALHRQGVLPGAVIVEFGSVRVHTMADLRARLYGLRPGDHVTLGIVEDGSMSRHSVALAASASP